MALVGEAYRRVYPEEWYSRFVQEAGVRPDGRPLHKARPTSLALGTVSTADGSALVKIGNTSVLAGIKLEVFVPPADTPDCGRIAVALEMPPICSPGSRPGRPPEEAAAIAHRLGGLLTSMQLVDMKQLCITEGQAAWVIYLDLYCLDADGSLFDAALLAATCALADLRIPSVDMTDEGNVVPAAQKTHQRLSLGPPAYALTCSLYKGQVLADVSAEEEAFADCVVTTVVDTHDRLWSVYKPGGASGASQATIRACIEASRKRARELEAILLRTLPAGTAFVDNPTSADAMTT